MSNPPRYDVRQKVKIMKTPEQMELGIGGARSRAIQRRHRKRQRARWWFHRMRMEVKNARDFQPNLPPAPEPPHLVFKNYKIEPTR